MANEVNANIRVDVDTSAALASLRQLQAQISKFNQSVVTTNSRATVAQQSMLNTLRAQIGASGEFSTSLVNVRGNVSRLQNAIDKNRLSMGEYFRYGVASSRTFGRIFGREHAEVMALATERVRKLQTQYIALGDAAGGMTKTLAVRPMSLFNADMAIGIQRSQLFNKMLNDGTTSLLNFGKNTQWAGRQLMVGFTIPLTIFGAAASRIFMDLEKQAISFRKVYGDIFTSEAETEQALEGIKELSLEFTKYGIAVKDSMEMASTAAQAGFRGEQLTAATTQATRLAVLGQMQQQEAMQATISLQTAFALSNEQLAEAVNFLNITENQSVLSLQDVAGAIPRVAPVINSLGGDVKDLAVLLVAMKEGGVSAAEGANALKNSLGRLIVPTSAAKKMAREFGIDLEGIVTRNEGKVMPMLAELAQTMEGLSGLEQQQLLSTIFGKFQYARIGALFKSLQDDASQASRVLQLTGLSVEQLAQTAEDELSVVEDSVSTKFVAALERAKVAIAPVGELFLKLATPILNGISKIFEKFNELNPTVKNFIAALVAGLGVATPVLIMLIGLSANFIANIIKGLVRFGQFITKLKGGGDAVNYMSNEQIEAAAAAASLEGKVTGLTNALNNQELALNSLIEAYQRYVSGAQAATSNLPQGFVGGGRGPIPTAGPSMPLNLENDPDNPFNSGQDFTTGYEEGINSGVPRVVSAVKGMIQQAIQTIKNTQQSQSPAQIPNQEGQNAAAGYAQGIRQGIPNVVAAAREMTAKATTTMGQEDLAAITQRMIQSGRAYSQTPEAIAYRERAAKYAIYPGQRRGNNPNIMLDNEQVGVPIGDQLVRSGTDLSLGYAEGVQKGIPKVNEAVSGMVKGAIQQIKKTQRSSSAAEEFKPPGEDATDGFAEGMRRGIPNVQRVAQEVTQAAKNAMANVVPFPASQDFVYPNRKDVNVPGGFESAHFGERKQFSESEIRQMLPKARAGRTKDLLEEALRTGKVLEGYSNEVVQVSEQLNQGLEQGTATVGMVRQDLVSMGRAPFAHQELKLQMTRLGASPEQIRSAIDSITTSIAKSIKDLADDAIITSKEFNEIVSNAYNETVQSNDQVVARARAQMQKTTTIYDPSARGGRGQRIAGPGLGSYKTSGEKYKQGMQNVSASTGLPLPYSMTGQFNIVPMAKELNEDLDKVIQTFDKFDVATKQRLASIRDNIQRFSAEFVKEAKKIGISIGEGLDLGAREGVRAASPAQDGVKLVDDYVEGMKIGAQQNTSEARQAGLTISNAFEGGLTPSQTRGGVLLGGRPKSIPLSSVAQYTSGYNPDDPFDQIRQAAVPEVPRRRDVIKNQLKETFARGALKVLGLGQETEKANKETKSFTQRMAGAKQGLINFNNKIAGASMGLSVATGALAMVPGTVGEMAQKVMPFTFGLTAVTQMLPMLMNPMGAATLGLAAVAIGTIAVVQSLKKINSAGKNYVEAMVGSSKKMEDFGKQLGTQTYSQRLTDILSRPLVDPVADEEAVSKAVEFVQSETGKQLLTDIETVAKTGGAQKGIEALKNQLTRAILTGVMDPKTAKEIAIVVAKELGDVQYSMQTIAQINQYLGPGGENLETIDGRIQMIADITANITNTGEVEKTAEEMYTAMGGFDRAVLRMKSGGGLLGFLGVGAEEARLTLQGQVRAQSIAQSTQMITEEYRKSHEQFLQGEITFDEYLKNQQALGKALQDTVPGWRNQIETINLTAESVGKANWEIKGYKDSIKNANKEKLSLSLGADFTREQFKETEKLLKQYENTDFGMNISVAFQNDQMTASQLRDFLLDLENKTPTEKEAIVTAIGKLGDFESDRLFRLFTLAEGKVPIPVLLNILSDPNTDVTKLLAQIELLAGSQVDVSVILKLPSAQRVAALQNVTKLLNEFDSIDPEDKEAITTFMNENFELTDLQIKEFLSLPAVSQRRFVANFATVGDIQDPNVATSGMMGFLRDEVGGKYKDYRYLEQLRKEGKLASTYFSEFFKWKPKDETETPKEPSPEPTGAGEKSWLQQFLADLAANSKLYLDANKGFPGYLNHRAKFIGYLKKLRGLGVPEEVIQSLSEGEEGLEQAMEIAGLGKGKIAKVAKELASVNLGRFMEKGAPAIKEDLVTKRNAQQLLRDRGVTESIAKDIASDSETAVLLVKTAATGTKKELNDLVKVLLEIQTLSTTPEEAAVQRIDDIRKATIDDLNRKEAMFKQTFGEIERQYQPLINSNKKRIEQLQDQITLVQKQINEIENLNKADQFRIRNLERQKEMLDRQVEAIERQNEVDQRRIDVLNREDEMRNRVSEALSKDLEIMSQQEEKITEAYDKRFKALDKVAKINDYITNQQKSQLNLSRAISEGDIYAATAAAQEMRAQSAQFSVEQTRAGLEAGMEGQIAGLRTAGGLTREQAEQQINQIKEQSYQTSLLIRDVEDQIYNRNLELLPLKDQIRNIDDQIRAINDIIYERETQVLQIQMQKLEPLQAQLDSEQESLRNNERALSDAKAAVMIEGLTYEELQNQISAEKEAYDVAVAMIKTNQEQVKSVENLVRRWKDVTAQIAAANRTARQLKEQAEEISQRELNAINADLARGLIKPDEAERRILASNERRASELRRIDEERVANIENYRQSGMDAMQAQGRYMGGLIKMGMGGKVNYKGSRERAPVSRNMGGKIRKYPMGGLIPYAMGGVAGDGGRDSVLAKLTPGEFVIRKAMVKKYGEAMMRDINMGSYSVPRYNAPMSPNVEMTRVNNNNVIAPVYNNYDMDFAISGSNASADDIANRVMFKIKQVQGSAIRTNRG